MAAQQETPKTALEGVTILDFTRVLAGPYCTMTLSDLGADVIKIENPKGGDESRSFRPPSFGDESSYFLAVNRNKRSIVLDVGTPDGQAIARELAANEEWECEPLAQLMGAGPAAEDEDEDEAAPSETKADDAPKPRKIPAEGDDTG